MLFVSKEKGEHMEWISSIKLLWRREKWYWLGAVAIGMILLIGVQWSKTYSQTIQDGISAKVVRFHVLANSDSPADQALKLEVRDQVLEEFGAMLAAYETKEETLDALEGAKEEICQVAITTLREAGSLDAVRVSVVREQFPLKQYDELMFPAGVYDALRIEIGEAQGQNWWCVLYPQMCYVDAAWGYTTEESYTRLENTLTDEEFLVVSALEQEAATPKIKFKIVELWQEL